MPTDCIAGHRAFIHDRGGIQRIAELENLARVIWGRVRDDASDGEVDISAVYCDPQSAVLNAIEPGRHELVIYRGDTRVWEGPITRIAYTSLGVSLFARDITEYLYFTAMESGYASNVPPPSEYVITRANRVLTTELTRRNVLELGVGLPSINVLPYLTLHQEVTDSKCTVVTVPMQYTVFEHIDKLAEDYGMDYTVVGRALHLWDTHEPLAQTELVTEADFLSDFTLTVYGRELGTRAISTDGQGVWGEDGGVDDYYGLWERLTTAYDEETDDGPPPSQSALESQAIRNLAGRNPTPLMVRVPDNSTINPRGVLNIDNLVPGVWVPMQATLLTRPINQMQKLDSMRVTEEPSGETVTVTLYPAPGTIAV